MTRKNRPVADRQKSLQPSPPKANVTLFAAREMYEAMGGKEFRCTINGYRRTRVFEFPGIDLHPSNRDPHHEIYLSPSVHANIVSDLPDFFLNSTCSDHYEISPGLRYDLDQFTRKVISEQKARIPVYLVVEESNQLTPVEMVNGECSVSDEIVVRDGKKQSVLAGGRDGEQFITAWATIDGAWPELPNNQQSVNMVLAGIRAGQETPDPIRKYLDRDGFVTDDGRFVVMMRPTMSGSLTTVTPMDTNAYRTRTSEIRNAIGALEQDIGTPHVALLVNSMYRDDYMDEAYQRLHYLQLWQSLSEAARKYLGYSGNIREDNVVVAGTKTLVELRDYRDDIAHWWTDTIDKNTLADLQRTINELLRRKYFRLTDWVRFCVRMHRG